LAEGGGFGLVFLFEFFKLGIGTLQLVCQTLCPFFIRIKAMQDFIGRSLGFNMAFGCFSVSRFMVDLLYDVYGYGKAVAADVE